MPKQRVDILYVVGIVGKVRIVRKYLNLQLSTEPLKEGKTPIYLRQHHFIMKVESAAGMLYLWCSKKFDTDRKAAKKLFREVAKELKIEGEIIEYRQVSELTVTEVTTKLQNNPDSLNELSKPISFRKDENLQLYAQGTLLILSKLKRMVLIDTKESRDELKLLSKLVGSVADKIA
jgi:hypothetical protein